MTMLKKFFASRFNRLNLIAAIFLSLASVVWLYPFLWPIFASFKTPQDMFSSGWHLWPNQWILDNYIRAWVNAKFSAYLMNSVAYCVTSTAIAVTVASMAGYALARYTFPGSRVIFVAMLGLLFLPAASGILPVFELMQSLHLLNSPWAIILVLIGSLSLNTLLFHGYFTNIPSELYDAGVMDGASFTQQFLLVLPLARPIIATTVIFTFMGAWTAFLEPLVFTLGKPELRTVAVGLRAFIGQYTVDISGFAAAETISVIPVIIVFLIFQKQIINGLAGAVKG